MGLARNFVVGLPKACGVPDGLSDIYAKHIGELFDFEKDHADSPLSRGNFKGHQDRLMPGFVWLPFAANQGAAEYALDLMVYASKCRDVSEKGAEIDGLEEDRAMLEADEADYPDVAALMTVDQASTMTSWN